MAKRFTPQTKEKARAMRASGMTYAEIAGEIGCTGPCVRYWCDEEARMRNHVNCGGRPDPNWVRISHQAGYQDYLTGLHRTQTNASDISDAERSAIQGIYSLSKALSESSGYPHEVDHIKPVSEGGEHRIWNLRIVPRYMNRTGRPKKGI